MLCLILNSLSLMCFLACSVLSYCLYASEESCQIRRCCGFSKKLPRTILAMPAFTPVTLTAFSDKDAIRLYKYAVRKGSWHYMGERFLSAARWAPSSRAKGCNTAEVLIRDIHAQQGDISQARFIFRFPMQKPVLAATPTRIVSRVLTDCTPPALVPCHN